MVSMRVLCLTLDSGCDLTHGNNLFDILFFHLPAARAVLQYSSGGKVLVSEGLVDCPAFLHGQKNSKSSVFLGSPGHQCVSRVSAHCNPFKSLVPQNFPFTKHPSLKLKTCLCHKLYCWLFLCLLLWFNIDILCIQFLCHAKWIIPKSVVFIACFMHV